MSPHSHPSLSASTIRSRRAHSRRTSLVVSAIALVAATTQSAAQSIGYSIVPTAQRVQWTDQLAFNDEWMYGGRVSVRFGSLIELQPFYFTGKNYGIDASRAPSVFGPQSNGRTLDLQHYGISTQLNLGRGNLVPFLRGGGGILRFDPASGSRQDRLAVTAGGGIRFGIGQLQAELFAEQLGFRLDPLRLFSGDSATGARSAQQKNFVYGGAVSIPLSVPQDEDDQAGLRGTTAPIEPFVGRLHYAAHAGLRDQNLAGIRAGIDFSPLFGVRGFYWRGVNETRDKFVSVEGYGAEGQFNLNTGPGINPYAIAGAGRISYSGSYRDSLAGGDKNRDALIVGAGASFQLSERIRLNAAVRDYIIARNDSIALAATSNDLTHNRMLTAGLTISIGGSSGASDRTRRLERDRVSQRRRVERRDDEMRMVGDSMRTMRRARVPQQKDSTLRWITIPVPTQGEVILRYGVPPATAPSDRLKGGAMPGARDTVFIHRDTIRMPRDTVFVRRDTMQDARDVEARNVDARVDGLRRQLEQLEQRLARAQADLTTSLSTPRNARRTADTVSTDALVVARYRGLALTDRIQQASARDLRPFIGLSAGDAGTQAVLSLRMDLGPLTPSLALMPEFAIGLGGDGTSVLALLNAQYRFRSLGGSAALRPYVTGGIGIFSPTVFGVNTAVGTAFELPRARGATPWVGYAELQGLNLFRDTRVMIGLSRR